MKAAVTVLVSCVAALLALGMVMLYSASMALVNPKTQEVLGAHLLVMQFAWCVLGLVFCIVAASIDYRLLKKFAWPLFALAIFLLLLVYAPVIGRPSHGARRWFGFAGFNFQPSEFAKLTIIIAVAWYGEKFQRQMPTFKRGIVIPGVFIGLMLGFIFIEPDRGTTILLASVTGTMLLLAGARWRYIIPPIFTVAAGLAFSFWHDPMRSARIYSWLHLEETKTGVGRQVYQSILALGSGGWTGLGLGNGRQTMGGWVAEQQTDFILATIGEQLGLIATLGVIVAFVVIVLCGIYIALNSRDTFGLLLACGITMLIGLQAFINIGVVTNTLPNKGLPLPFISYGGSNLFMMLGCVGVLLSVARHAIVSESRAESISTDKIPSPELT
jgi:cell division protein FtsW